MYNQLRNNAKGRGIHFSITKKYWRQFCLRTSYHLLVGTGSQDLTVDRIRINEGYRDGNIQALPNADNVRKYKKIDAMDKMRGLVVQWEGERPF